MLKFGPSSGLSVKNKEPAMNRLNKTIAIGLVTLMTVSGAFAAKKPKTIKIGFNIPLTGDSPKVGESAKFAGELIKTKTYGRIHYTQPTNH